MDRLNQVAGRLANLLARGAVMMANAAGKMQILQVSLLADEKKQLEHFEPFGFTSCPKPGAEVLAAFLDGDRSHGVVIVAADRRYRVQGLAAGDSALYDAHGHEIRLTASGIEIRANGSPVLVNDGDVIVTGGDVIADGVSLKSMS